MSEPAKASSSRIAWIDIARGIALIAMAIYHFAWDLEFFGYAPAGMTAFGGWKYFARGIASTFLFLVGVSLFLAHRKGVRWPPFWRRFAMVALAALAITAVTWFATPQSFIFFGILHQIAFASVVGLLFLRLPPIINVLAGIAVIAIAFAVATPLLDGPLAWWIGLSEQRPRSNDFVPVFPWFGAVLLGIGAAGLAKRKGLFVRLAMLAPGKWSRPLVFIGRHSLAFYLIHQPVLISLIWLFSQIAPPSVETRQSNFIASCRTACTIERSERFCAEYCGCVQRGLFSGQHAGSTPSQGEDFQQRLSEQVLLCTASTEIIVPPEPEP